MKINVFLCAVGCENRRFPTNALMDDQEIQVLQDLNKQNNVLNRHKKIEEKYVFQPVCGEIPDVEYTFAPGSVPEGYGIGQHDGLV